MSFSPHLVVLQGPLTGQNLPLRGMELVVGREAAPPFQLATYKEVSRRHARLFVQNGGWCIEDVGSTNGTFVNGARITSPITLREGDVLRLGDFQARFAAGASQNAALPPGATQMSPPIPFPFVPQQPYPPAPQQPYPTVPVAAPKNAGTAILCSFLLVGGGQFYNGEVEKGLAMLGVSLLCGFFGFFLCGIPFIGCLAMWIWSLIDAPQSAERINRKNSGQPF